MNIGLDATPLTEPTGGISRYTAELTRALAERFPEDRFYLLSDQEFVNPASDFANVRTGTRPENALERRWWLWGVQNRMTRLGIQIFHGTGFEVPCLPRGPSVLSLHDLSPWNHPSWQPAAKRVRRRTPLLLRLAIATLVVTPTEAVRRQAVEQFHLSGDRVIAVPHAAPLWCTRVTVEPRLNPYFLYVGTLEPRKNIGLLLRAWRQVRTRRQVDLILAGRRRSDFPPIPPEPGLNLMGPVRDEELPALYSGCVACLYPSFYEGFGFPILEAMQCGAAVITSRDPAILETAGKAALALDAQDVRGWSEALTRALDDPQWVPAMRDKSLRQARQFSWNRTAERTREVYEEAIRRFRKGK